MTTETIYLVINLVDFPVIIFFIILPINLLWPTVRQASPCDDFPVERREYHRFFRPGGDGVVPTQCLGYILVILLVISWHAPGLRNSIVSSYLWFLRCAFMFTHVNA